LGSTARWLATVDGPPTVIVPSGWDPGAVAPDAPVVVDVTDGVGDHVERALATAMARADRDDRPVVAVAPWHVPGDAVRTELPIAEVWSDHADRAERELEERLAPWRTAYPRVRVVAVATDRH